MGNRVKKDYLNHLHDERIFSISLVDDDKSIRFTEECDMWFTHEFNKKDFGNLIKELQSVHKQMK